MLVFSPIVLFVYNRPWHTIRTIEALQKNHLASQSQLFIFSDASKTASEVKNVKEVRNYIKNITGFKSVQVCERPQNLGLAKSIINGVTEIVNKFGKVIVLEDDLVTSPYFLEYMNSALSIYEHKQEVISIHGYVYPLKRTMPPNFFLKGADCWGWATWKRGWDLFEPDGKKLLNEITNQNLIEEFDFNNSYPYFKMLKDQVEEKNSSWAIRWYASAFLKNKLTLYPGTSYVQNIGLDNSGTHCEESDKFSTKMQTKEVKLEEIELRENREARKAFEAYFKLLRPKIYQRIISRISKPFR